MASTDVLTLQEAFFHHDGFMPNYLCLFLFLIISISSSVAEDNNCYELRVYTAAEGKLEELHNRFKNHTCKLLRSMASRILDIGYRQINQIIAYSTSSVHQTEKHIISRSLIFLMILNGKKRLETQLKMADLSQK